MAEDCLFCRIVRKEIPATVVAETDDCLAFRDIDPKAPVHVLVIPKQHIASLDQASDAELVGKVVLLASRIAQDEGVAAEGYRVVFNTNRGAGQTVFHLHAHVLGGRPLRWPPG